LVEELVARQALADKVVKKIELGEHRSTSTITLVSWAGRVLNSDQVRAGGCAGSCAGMRLFMNGPWCSARAIRPSRPLAAAHQVQAAGFHRAVGGGVAIQVRQLGNAQVTHRPGWLQRALVSVHRLSRSLTTAVESLGGVRKIFLRFWEHYEYLSPLTLLEQVGEACIRGLAL
jgi:hypothetical protein